MSQNNIPPDRELLEAVAAQVPRRKLTPFGIVETTPAELGIFRRLDKVINKLLPNGCPVISHGKPDCSFCELLEIQKEIRALL